MNFTIRYPVLAAAALVLLITGGCFRKVSGVYRD